MDPLRAGLCATEMDACTRGCIIGVSQYVLLEPKGINMTGVYIYLSTPPSTGAASCHQATEEYMYTTVLPRGFVGGWLIGQAPNFIMHTLLELVEWLQRDPQWVGW